MKTLENATMAELEARMKELRNEAARKTNEGLQERYKLLLDNIDKLLELCPEHSCTSCSDNNPGNYTSSAAQHHYRCARCQLLYIKKYEYNDEYVVTVTLTHMPLLEIRK